MPRIRRDLPKHVYPIRDRYGNERYYFRRRHHKNVPMPGLPWSAEMMAAHAAVLANAEPIKIGESGAIPGSIHAAIGEYLSSSAFVTNRRNGTRKAEATTHKMRWILDRFRNRVGPNGKRFGDRPLIDLQQKHVQAILDDMREVPASARDLLKALRGLMRWAKRNGRIKVDPTAEVDPPPMKPSEGYPTWEDEHVTRFESRWPVGTPERLALILMIWTGQRREDIVIMGRQHLRPDGFIYLRQQKTGKEVPIPVLADELRNAIAVVPADQMDAPRSAVHPRRLLQFLRGRNAQDRATREPRAARAAQGVLLPPRRCRRRGRRHRSDQRPPHPGDGAKVYCQARHQGRRGAGDDKAGRASGRESRGDKMSTVCCKHRTPMLQTRQICEDNQGRKKRVILFARAQPILRL